MPESIPAPLIIDTLKDMFREARAALAAEGVRRVTSTSAGSSACPTRTRRPCWRRSTRSARCACSPARPRTRPTRWRPALDGRRAVRADDPARRALRLHQHAARRGHGRARADLLHDRAAESREGQGPARVAPLDGALLRAAARRLGVPHARLEGPDDVHLIPEYYRLAQEAPRAGPWCSSAWRPPDGHKPEDALQAIAAARGDAVCVPTMTTSPRGARSRPTISPWAASASWAAPRRWDWGWPWPGPIVACSCSTATARC